MQIERSISSGSYGSSNRNRHLLMRVSPNFSFTD